MPILTEAFHAPLALLVFLSGLVISILLCRKFLIRPSRGVLLYFWHSVFALAYFFYSLIDVADATKYYSVSLTHDISFPVGTSFVYSFTRIFSYFLSFDYLSVFLVYNVIGSIGLLAFYASMLSVSYDKSISIRRLVFLIILLPSISFWSSAIGKDSIAFMATGLALWSVLDFNKRSSIFLLSVVFMFLVRPHIAGMMIIAISMSHILTLHQSITRRLFFISLIAGIGIFLVPFAIKYVGLSQVSVTEVSEFIDSRQSYNQSGGGAVDISSMSLPLQLFTYIFRPLPFEARSIMQLASSLDNLLLIVLAIAGCLGLVKGRRFSQVSGWVFMLSFAIGCWFILAVTTANLGIAVRQKWMFMPMLIVLFISVAGRSKSPRVRERS